MSTPETARYNILIDTDIGDDADDVLALALALNTPDINILGVTTVFKNTLARAQLARHFLKLSGRDDIPVHAGLSQPLKGSVNADEIPCQHDAGMNLLTPDSCDAVSFLADRLRRQPARIICIGPLTNIATLLNNHPQVIDKIQELVIMGGSYYRHATEWNILCDPEAADLVFRSGINIRALGLDVTTRCTLSADQLALLNTGDPCCQFLYQMCKRWLAKSGHLPMLHDPLTIYSLTDRDNLRYRGETVHIELTGDHTRGMTFCEDHGIWGRSSPNPNVQAAFDIDAPVFVDYFLTTLTTQLT